MGSRWGLYSEASFRNGLKGILQDSFGVEVINLNEYDHDGEVFGRPDQVEIDVIIKNGTVILGEIKSNIDKGGIDLLQKSFDAIIKGCLFFCRWRYLRLATPTHNLSLSWFQQITTNNT